VPRSHLSDALRDRLLVDLAPFTPTPQAKTFRLTLDFSILWGHALVARAAARYVLAGMVNVVVARVELEDAAE
jgi:hypothetical protein